MKEQASLTFESRTALANIARGLRQARLLRGESQATAAARAGVGIATWQRMESPDSIAGVASGSLLTALCLYGFAADVVALGDPARDSEGRRLSGVQRQRGRTLGGPHGA
jgi:broad specificity phosphatase PhoE